MTNEMRLQQDEENRKRLATRDFDKNFLVSAGAGAGKTYTTVERAFNMLCARRVKPSEIVMITFTRKAATEMKDRLNRWIREKIDEEKDEERLTFLNELLSSLPEMQISTIHSFCRKVLNAFPLQSDTGFAPEYESEERSPSDSRSDRFFNNTWPAVCTRSIEAGIDQNMVKCTFSFLNNKPSVHPQFVDPDSPEGQELYKKNLDECERLVRIIRQSKDPSVWNMLNWKLREPLLEKENATPAQILKAGNLLAKKGVKAQKWMGCRTGKTLCEALKPLAKKRSISEEDIQKAEAVRLKPGKVSKDEKRNVYESLIHELPIDFQAAAEVAALLPGEEELKALDENLSLMLHGICVKDALVLRNQYEKYRRDNHIVTLNDMLQMTAEVVKSPGVRRQLHEWYKVFFVDEYQDTDPIQTDIIFAIAAGTYDPDWHKSIPAPGSLFLVGDAKQAIYRFRGADIALWKEAADVIQKNGGKVLDLFRNYRSTDEICGAVETVFGASGPLKMVGSDVQAEFGGMVSNDGHGVNPAVIHHVIASRNPETYPDIKDAAIQIAQMISERVRSGQNTYGDFLLISYNKETNYDYTDMFRDYRIPVTFDGKLPMSRYMPIQRLNLRVQSVCHPFDENLAFQVLNECFGVKPQEWDLFRMNLKKLPREIIDKDEPTVHTAVFAAPKIREVLPQTEMNLKILDALDEMNRDDCLSRNRTPCAFLRELTENVDGLFIEELIADDYQNHYAALLHVIDSIEEQHPEHFTDMADILKSFAEGEMERMPSVHADSNFVRLMNLHKVKGLEGKIVVFLPGGSSSHSPDNHVERDGIETKGWMIVKDRDNRQSPQYKPVDWETQSEKEKALLGAEETRKLYVALTRAQEEIHFFDFPADQNGKKPKSAWDGFDSIGETIMCDAAEEAIVLDEELENDPRAEREQLLEARNAVNVKHYARITPSGLEKMDYLPVTDYEELDDEPEDVEDDEKEDVPGGKDWGTAIHRAAELIVSGAEYGNDSVRAAAKLAVEETFKTEILTEKERASLMLPKEAKTLEEIQTFLAENAVKVLAFMTDETSDFRRAIVDAEVYTELPFMVSITEVDNKEAFFALKAAVGGTSADEIRIEISGKIDLALRYPDGSWQIMDYKTDRMLPEEQGNRDAFLTRLGQQYRKQLEIYKIVLEYLTGEKVVEAKILSV